MTVRCPFSGYEPIHIESGYENIRFIFDAPRTGGRYCTKQGFGALVDQIEELGKKGKARLITLLVDMRRLGVEEPELTFDLIDKAKVKPDLSRIGRAMRLLEFLAKESNDVLGRKINISDDKIELVLAWIESTMSISLGPLLASKIEPRVSGKPRIPQEVSFLCDYLENQKLIAYASPEKDSVNVTMDGFSYLDKLSIEVDSNKAFVAMWFDDSMNDVYEHGFSPAIRDAGYENIRIDRIEHSDKIDDRIISEIRRSKFIVADFTQGISGTRGGVYYEAGFAFGLGIPVIYTCKKDCICKVHFDTRQYNHLLWETSEDLREKLKNRIIAVVGKGTSV